jgi:hypothetical protein
MILMTFRRFNRYEQTSYVLGYIQIVLKSFVKFKMNSPIILDKLFIFIQN